LGTASRVDGHLTTSILRAPTRPLLRILGEPAVASCHTDC
jgi:hypothetical protein